MYLRSIDVFRASSNPAEHARTCDPCTFCFSLAWELSMLTGGLQQSHLTAYSARAGCASSVGCPFSIDAFLHHQLHAICNAIPCHSLLSFSLPSLRGAHLSTQTNESGSKRIVCCGCRGCLHTVFQQAGGRHGDGSHVKQASPRYADHV